MFDEEKIGHLAQILSKQIDKENFKKKYAPVRDVLILVGIGAFVATSLVVPNLPLVLKPLVDKQRKDAYEAWKRFNIPHLKRTLQRLEEQKLVEFEVRNNMQIIKITDSGKGRILKFALDELKVGKPKFWDRSWRLVSFDIPEQLKSKRGVLVEYLTAWGFYQLHKSVYLHAYPCLKQVDFLRGSLGIGEYVRLFTVSKIENNQVFRNFFGV